MRIVGEIPHPSLKITIFLHDSKYAVKFESGLYEQTYKFRTGDLIQSEKDLKSLITEEVISEVQVELTKMHQRKLTAISKWMEDQDDEFEEII